MSYRIGRIAGPCILFLLGFMATASADPAPAPAGMSQDAAVAMVRERTGGKVVRAEARLDNDAIVYYIRVLTPDGRLRVYQVDAATGTMR